MNHATGMQRSALIEKLMQMAGFHVDVPRTEVSWQLERLYKSDDGHEMQEKGNSLCWTALVIHIWNCKQSYWTDEGWGADNAEQYFFKCENI